MLKLFQVTDVHICPLMVLYYKLTPPPPEMELTIEKVNIYDFSLIKTCGF
jgi:hypothetical protein